MTITACEKMADLLLEADGHITEFEIEVDDLGYANELKSALEDRGCTVTQDVIRPRLTIRPNR
jgi:hypothetical protein